MLRPGDGAPHFGNPGLRSAILAGALLGSLAPAVPAAAEGYRGGPYEEARREAAGDGKPILLFFPSPRGDDLPAPLQDAAALRRAAGRLHFAQARAEDVTGLLGTFRLSQVPALLLLDRASGVVERWEKTIPADLWVQVDRATRRLRAAEEEAARCLAEARSALARGDHPAVLAQLAKARAAGRKGPVSDSQPQMEEAPRLEAQVLARAASEVRRTLGREGIVPDKELQSSLAAIRTAFPHPAVAERIDREIARLKARPIAGGE